MSEDDVRITLALARHNAMMAERERCAGIVRAFLQYTTKAGSSRDECISAMRGALCGLDPIECKSPLSREQELIDWAEDARTTERERCAKAAQAIVAKYEALCDQFSGDETWTWAINEMSDAVNGKWCEATSMLTSIPDKIRSGE